jgi:ribose/xylose/arabinose/galactoside ABC-type transport system permease subunit
MAILRNAFVLLHFPIHWQTVTIGIVIVLAVATDRLRKRS